MEIKDDKKSAKQKRPANIQAGSRSKRKRNNIQRLVDDTERIIARDVPASRFTINNDKLVFKNYTLRNQVISELNPAYLSKIFLTFTLIEDKSKGGSEPQFKFASSYDLIRLIKAIEEQERRYQQSKQTIFPAEVKGSDFTLKGDRLYYMEYNLWDKRLEGLDPTYFAKVRDVFTIIEDRGKHNSNRVYKFKFRQKADLYKFINAVRQAQDKDVRIEDNPTGCVIKEEPSNRVEQSEAQYYPATGIFCLPWEYVTFYEGRMLLKHPKTAVSATLHPFIFSHQLIHKSFNDMKEYFNKSCDPLKVVASGSEIKELLNFTAFIKFIRELNTYSENTEADYEIKDGKPLKPGSTLTLNELKNRRVIKKSPYISMLSKIHVPSLPIYYLLENVVHRSSEFSSEEHGYLFAIRQSMGEVIAVYENISDDSRASMVFRCSSYRYDEAVKWISTFLSSEVENKRELIARGQIKVSNSMVRDLLRVLHTDQDRWRTQILNLRLYGF